MTLYKRDPIKKNHKVNTVHNKKRLYPDSRVELTPFAEKYYDIELDIATLGLYKPFIKKAIKSIHIQPEDKIIDFGCGTGRNACLMAKYLNLNGKITGLDISEIMHRHFEKKCKIYPNIHFRKQRIDQPFNLHEKFDKAFMSFVFHGFPQEVRKTILQNALTHLKKGGTLNILDYSEFDIQSIPFHHRLVFNFVEGKCKYAYDFIKRDWKQILSNYDFGRIEELFFVKNYIRLLKAQKIQPHRRKPIFIAIPSNDGTNIFPKMLGMAKYMFIYQIENGEKFKFIEKRTNPYEKTMQHLKTLDVYEIINDCEIIVSSRIGKKGIERLQERGIRLLFKKGNIQEAMTNLIKEQAFLNI
jgi:ubiquinone/menaquinone biosynthesis C-methylase UbiE/predicted Fe-Mo cluster-binding NifX family protein